MLAARGKNGAPLPRAARLQPPLWLLWLSGEQVKMVRAAAGQLRAPCSGQAGAAAAGRGRARGLIHTTYIVAAAWKGQEFSEAPCRLSDEPLRAAWRSFAALGTHATLLGHPIAGRRPQGRWPQQEGPQDRPQEREPLCEAAGQGEPPIREFWRASWGPEAGHGAGRHGRAFTPLSSLAGRTDAAIGDAQHVSAIGRSLQLAQRGRTAWAVAATQPLGRQTLGARQGSNGCLQQRWMTA